MLAVALFGSCNWGKLLNAQVGYVVGIAQAMLGMGALLGRCWGWGAVVVGDVC